MKCIIFDMDGVIVDTEPQYRKRIKAFCEGMGFQVSEEVYDLTCGSNMKHTYRLFKDHVTGFHLSYDEYMKARKKYAKEQPVDPVKYVDKQIYPLLDWLKKKKIHIALASSSPLENIIRYLTELKIIDYFELLVSGTEFRNSKPDPEIYDYTMRKMHANVSECLIVEDSVYGITAGKKAGAVVIAKKDERFGQDQSEADYIIDDLLQIKEIIEGEGIH